MMAFSQREQRLLFITGIIAVVGLTYIGWSIMSDSMAQSDVSAATQDRFQDLFEKIENVETQKARNQQLKVKLGNKEGKFIQEDEVHKFLAELEKVTGQSGVQLKSTSFNQNMRSKPVPRLDVNLSIQCQFPQLITFLDNLRKADIVCQTQTLKCGLIDQNRPDLDVKLTVSTYMIDAKTQRLTPSAIVRG